MPVVILFNRARATRSSATSSPGPRPTRQGQLSVGRRRQFVPPQWRTVPAAAGFEAVHLPFKGAPEAITEVLAGRIDFYFSRCQPAAADGGRPAPGARREQPARATALPDMPTDDGGGLPQLRLQLLGRGDGAGEGHTAPDHRDTLPRKREGACSPERQGERSSRSAPIRCR